MGELRIDLEKRAVSVGGRPVQLTPHEFALLRVLARNPGKLLTHATLLREVWGRGYAEESHYLHVYVSQLRRKLEADPARPRYILTEPGAGYRSPSSKRRRPSRRRPADDPARLRRTVGALERFLRATPDL